MFGFSEKDRLIFEWHDGDRVRYSDPLEIRRAIAVASQGQLFAILKDATYEELPAGASEMEHWMQHVRIEEANGKLAAIVRKAFGLQPFDQDTLTGCTEQMCHSLWAHYCNWLKKKDTRDAPPPASSASADSPPPGQPPTRSSSA